MDPPALNPQAERDQCPLAAFRLRLGPEPVRTGFWKRGGALEDTARSSRWTLTKEARSPDTTTRCMRRPWTRSKLRLRFAKGEFVKPVRGGIRRSASSGTG